MPLTVAVLLAIAAMLVPLARSATPPASRVAYPRIEQAAGIIDLLRETSPSLRPALLRALDSATLDVEIADHAPAETATLQRAPRVEARLRDFAAPGLGEELRAYTDATVPQRTSDTEGWPARVVWPMPDGHVLVLTTTGPSRAPRPAGFGGPPGLWLGLSAIAVALLTLVLTHRQTRAVRLLTAAAANFDGQSPLSPVAEEGAPELRRLARAVQDMQQRVTALLQERSFLIGAISHDLKTYLTRLRLRTEGFPDVDQRSRAAADLDAMTDLIDTALAFARGTSVSEHRSLVDLADLVAIEVAERAAAGQTVVATGDDQADAVVLGDPIALRRVLANLVDNAVKFGGGQVELSLGREAGRFRLSVADDGPGMTEAERTAIFSPFYRLEGSRNRRTGGSGLGLAIARQIVEAHGGMIEVSGGRLGGACFTVTLPNVGRH